MKKKKKRKGREKIVPLLSWIIGISVLGISHKITNPDLDGKCYELIPDKIFRLSEFKYFIIQL